MKTLSLLSLSVCWNVSFADTKLRTTSGTHLQGDRLESGQLVAASDGGFLGRGSLKHQAEQLAVSTAGSSLLARQPGQSTSIVCLEGHATIKLTGKSGHFRELQAGESLLVPENANKLPDVAVVRLATLKTTHPLLRQGLPNATAQAQFDKAIAKQEKAIAKGKLIISGVSVKGGRTSVSNNVGGGSNSQSGSGSSSGSSGGGSSSGGGASSSGGAAAPTGGATAIAAAGCG